MRNDDHRALALVEHALEPANRVDVEVIGGLVEQHDVGIREQRLREQYAQLPARRHLAHRPLMQRLGDAYGEQQLARRRLGRVAVERRELVLELGGVQPFFLAHRGLRVEPVALLIHLPQTLVTHDHGVEDGELLERELILPQLADARVRRDRYVAVRGLELAAQNLEESRLARAVRADQAITMAVAELDGHVLEQRFLTELDGDVGCGNHGGSGPGSRGVGPEGVHALRRQRARSIRQRCYARKCVSVDAMRVALVDVLTSRRYGDSHRSLKQGGAS